MESIDRNLILVVGDSPFDLVPFTQRDLTVQRVSLNVAPQYFEVARGTCRGLL